MRVHPVAAAGFGAAADVYERARPSYPQEAIAWLVERTGLGPGKTVVDVGAGTGKLTRLLVPTGAHVVAVEPVPEMRAKLRSAVPGAEALEGTAEELPLADRVADAVTVAQAFHWFDHDRALPELHRVLKPRGALVLVWNMRDVEQPLQRALEELLAPLRSVADAGTVDWRGALARSELFGEPEEASFRHEQRLTLEGLRERVSSTSFVATMPSREREELLARVRALADGLEEPLAFPYVTEVYVARKVREGSDP